MLTTGTQNLPEPLARVQSTPLVDYAGHLVGMVSTHFQRPHRPSDRGLRVMELFADFADEALTAHLGQAGLRAKPA
jgi:hypothetical protein